MPLSDRERALAVILDEHRSIACVIRGMQELVRESRERKVALDLLSLEGMLTYMREFPLGLHHPKEEQYLHRMLRERHPGCETLLRRSSSSTSRSTNWLRQPAPG